MALSLETLQGRHSGRGRDQLPPSLVHKSLALSTLLDTRVSWGQGAFVK